MCDYDNIGGGGWTPVGLIGGAFLESPGNPYDGIDNDGDGVNGSGPAIIESHVRAERTLNAGDTIVLINYKTFERTVIPMPDDTLADPLPGSGIQVLAGQGSWSNTRTTSSTTT